MKLTNTTINIKFACVFVLGSLLLLLPVYGQEGENRGGGGEYAYTNNLPDPAGLTFVLGGLLLQTGPVDNRNGDRIPFLSNIPILGGLFRNTRSNGGERQYLLIFLTPRITRDE